MLGFFLALIDEPNDKEKFLSIYNYYKDIMHRKAMSILHNISLAEEAVQESFFKIAKNISKISSPIFCSKTASFIVIIVRNTSYDILRSENIDNSIPYDESVLDIPSIEMPDIEDVLSNGGIKHIIKIIYEMDKIYTDAITLKYLHGYSYSEIAELLDISVKNAQMRVYRAKSILKTKLEEDGYVIK